MIFKEIETCHDNTTQKNERVCKLCNFTTNKKTNYNNHLKTKKHLNMVSGIKKILKCNFCEKIFDNRNTLWYHNKKCNNNTSKESNNNLITIEKDIILKLIKQCNREHDEKKDLQNIFIENTNKLIELSENIMNQNIQPFHSSNKKFNLTFFLNEQCKQAINISDFVNNIQVEIDEVTKVGKIGFVNGITNIFMKNLIKYNKYSRPIHCTDLKREVLYIRENNQWIKETDNKTMKQYVDKLAMKNCQKIALWQDIYQESKILDSPTYNLWLEIIGQSMNNGEQGERNTHKVIKNIIKEVFLDKQDEGF